jgi:hypothetical protein
VTFGAEVHAEDVVDRAELWLHFVTRDRSQSMEEYGPAITGRRDWTRQEITVQVPEDAELIRFGLTVTGAGRVRLRSAELIRVGDRSVQAGRSSATDDELWLVGSRRTQSVVN